MTGCAWPDKRVLETPEPRSIKSFVILAHEVGHVALEHRGRAKPRWAQEVEAWEFALAQVRAHRLPGRRKAQEYAEPRIAQAFWRALRRGADVADIEAVAAKWWKRSLPYLAGLLEE